MAVDNYNNPHIVYYLDDDVSLNLVYATRKNNEWLMTNLSENYKPYIPDYGGLQFGGRTSPALMVSNNDIYFVWRSNFDGSPIILKMFDVSMNKFSDEKVIGRLSDEPFSSAPSMGRFESPVDSQIVLWSYKGRPIIYIVK